MRGAIQGRPVLIVAYGSRSISPMQLADAARELCDIVWLVDGRDLAMGSTSRLLAKLGAVVDRAGMSPGQAADALRPFQPAGIATFHDTGMEDVAAVGQELALAFHQPLIARRLVDKEAQRAALRTAGLPVPQFWAMPSRTSDEAAPPAPLSFPAVLKPRQGSGSWHTFLVRDAEDLERFCGDCRLADEHEELILEEYIPDGSVPSGQRSANYVSVESVVSRGYTRHLAITGRFPPADPFRETGFFIPSDLDDVGRVAVLETATAAIHALEIEVGCVHTEVKMTPDGPRVIEVNGRLGGGVPEMLGLAAGFPMLDLSIRLALGEEAPLGGLVTCQRIGYRFLVQPPTSARRVTSVHGLDRVRSLPGVVDVYLHHLPGEAVDWRHGSRAYVFSVTGSASDLTELCAVDRLLHEQVSIRYER